jgi:hypothetical protein
VVPEYEQGCPAVPPLFAVGAAVVCTVEHMGAVLLRARGTATTGTVAILAQPLNKRSGLDR